MAIVVKGDAMSPESVAKAFSQIEQVDAVVSTIGGTPADPTADSQARTFFFFSSVCGKGRRLRAPCPAHKAGDPARAGLGGSAQWVSVVLVGCSTKGSLRGVLGAATTPKPCTL